jgi:hypothetical protein
MNRPAFFGSSLPASPRFVTNRSAAKTTLSLESRAKILRTFLFIELGWDRAEPAGQGITPLPVPAPVE